MLDNLVQRFQNVVDQYPDETAVVCDGRALSYKQLDAHANAVAQALLSQPGQQDAPVALLVSQNAPAIIGIMGVLKAGRAYALLSAESPYLHNRRLVEDLTTLVVLTENSLFAQAMALCGTAVRVMNIETIGERPARGQVPVRLSGSSLAAIHYTSGSTGQPKGVMRTHDIILGRLQIEADNYRTGPGDCLALIRPIHTSSASVTIFNALLNGAALHIFDLQKASITALARWLDTAQITYLRVNAEVLRLLTEYLPAGFVFTHLRYCRPSGRLYHKDLLRLLHCLPDQCIVGHGLGSTEAELVSHFVIDRHAVPDGEIIPIGRPVEGVEVSLCDENGQAVPPGQVGEIVINSRSVSTGYWNRPGLTARKFEADPHDPRRRIFKSGDLGRWRTDGLLQFVGRVDDRVKVGGNRVVLGELEMLLEHLDGVHRAVVVAHEDEQGDARLFAYVEPKTGGIVSVSALRLALSQEAPPYMMPAQITILENLPEGASGKVDRRALSEPDLRRPALETSFVAPRSALEGKIAALWADYLHLDRVGVYDSFLELGGQSLQAIQIMNRIQDEFDVDVALGEFLTASTVAALASAVSDNRIHS